MFRLVISAEKLQCASKKYLSWMIFCVTLLVKSLLVQKKYARNLLHCKLYRKKFTACRVISLLAMFLRESLGWAFGGIQATLVSLVGLFTSALFAVSLRSIRQATLLLQLIGQREHWFISPVSQAVLMHETNFNVRLMPRRIFLCYQQNLFCFSLCQSSLNSPLRN